MDCEILRQQKQTQINKDTIRENNEIVDHDHKFGDKFMLTNNTAYKCETLYNNTFFITQIWNNSTVTIQYGATKTIHSIRCIKPYISDTNVEDVNIKNVNDTSQHMITRYILLYFIKDCKQGI